MPPSLLTPTTTHVSVSAGSASPVLSAFEKKATAKKAAKNALSCIDFDDLPGAKMFLQEALQALQ